MNTAAKFDYLEFNHIWHHKKYRMQKLIIFFRGY